MSFLFCSPSSSPMGNFVLAFASFLLIFFPIPTFPSSLYPRGDLIVSDDLATVVHSTPSPSPTTFFEVRRPIPTPKSKPCSTLILHHSFAYTYNLPPVTSTYTPPSHCPFHLSPSLIVLEWSASCSGRQFDRIFGVWLAGVELLRSCTAEPRPTGIIWSVRKDVTRYASLFLKPQTLAVYLGNIVDEIYTGVYHVNVSFHFYFDHHRPVPPAFDSPADLIIPISKTLPLNDGLWFQIQNSRDLQGKEVAVPRNAYRGLIEVYLSFHSNDEFWYANPPNSYISENNLTGIAGNGAFREVTVRLDGDVVGVVWPFTVIYTGGVNPLLWRPISAIGSFDLPSYDIEITPFLGKILDGKMHSIEFGVTDALDVWFIDANLHLWLDSRGHLTEGALIEYEAPGFAPSLISDFKGLDGNFDTSANRRISAIGWVMSSYGNITTHFFQNLYYSNTMKFAGNGSIQEVNQNIYYNHGTYAEDPSAVLYSEQVFQSFPLYLYTGTSDQVNDSYLSIVNVTLGFIEEWEIFGEQSGLSFSTLRNLQTGEGIMRVKGNLVTSGVANTQQVYRYRSTDGCYFRNVSSSNYNIVYDESRESCTKSSLIRSLEHSSPRLLPPIRRMTI